MSALRRSNRRQDSMHCIRRNPSYSTDIPAITALAKVPSALTDLLDHLDAQDNLGRYINVSREGFGMTFNSRRRCIPPQNGHGQIFNAAPRDKALAAFIDTSCAYLLHVLAAQVFRDEIYLLVRSPCSKAHRKSLKILK